MINHAYAVLYNGVKTINGIYTPLKQPLTFPDDLAPFYTLWLRGGPGKENASLLALHYLKVLYGSSQRGVITEFDSRLTFDPIKVNLTQAGAPFYDVLSPSRSLNDAEFLPLTLARYNASAGFLFANRPKEGQIFYDDKEPVQERVAVYVASVIREMTTYNNLEAY